MTEPNLLPFLNAGWETGTTGHPGHPSISSPGKPVHDLHRFQAHGDDAGSVIHFMPGYGQIHQAPEGSDFIAQTVAQVGGGSRWLRTC
jgi:hypothetical protein